MSEWAKTEEEKVCVERAKSCAHRWSHNPPNPETAKPRPYCLDCGIDIDNRLSHFWKHGHAGGPIQ